MNKVSHSQAVQFPGAAGDQLDALLDLPLGDPRAFVLFAHCFTCSKNVLAASRIASGLVAQGFAVLRFDFTGLGESEGEFADTTFSSNVGDLVAASDWLAAHHEAPKVLVGHSLGGAAVLAATARLDHVEAVATVAAPADPVHVEHLMSSRLDEIAAAGRAEVTLAGRSFCISQEFVDDIRSEKLKPSLQSLDAALLVLHSPIDELVGVDNAREIFEAARHPKSFVALDGADHLLTKRTDAAFAADIIATWASRYLQAPLDENSAPTAEGAVIVETAEGGGFAQDIRAGRHSIRADEPIGIGDDTGPNPYELLLSALGACTSMTIKMYADRKQWDLDSVHVELTHDRNHADDCADVDGRCRVERIERTVQLSGNLDVDQRAKLMEIADKCPVHKTLTGEIRVITTEG